MARLRSHGELVGELLRIRVAFLPYYSRTKLQLSSPRKKHDMGIGLKGIEVIEEEIPQLLKIK